MHIDLEGQRFPIRSALFHAIEDAWGRVGQPGTWWSGGERVAIASECRRADACDFCSRRKAALSPYTVDGQHETDGVLPADAVEAIHRLKTDAGRITEAGVRELGEGALGE